MTRIDLGYRRFVIAEFAIVAALFAASLVITTYSYLTSGTGLEAVHRLLELGTEANLPTFWSTFNLLVAALLLLVIAGSQRAARAPRWQLWFVLAGGLALMAVDEAAGLHENASLFQGYTGALVPVLQHNAWVLYGAIVAVVVGVAMIPLLASLPRDTQLRFLLAGFVFLGGALGLEAAAGAVLYSWVEARDDIELFLRQFEEGAEMLGIAIFNVALFREIVRRELSVNVSFSAAVGESEAASDAVPRHIDVPRIAPRTHDEALSG